MPNKVQSWSWACRNWISNAGIWASVCESVVCCWATSSSRDGSGVEAGLDDLQDVALQFRVLPGQFDLFLVLAHLDVVLRHVAQQGDQHGVVVLHRRVQIGLGGQHLAAVQSPEVQFPGQVEAEIPTVVELGNAGEKLARRQSAVRLIAAGGVLASAGRFRPWRSPAEARAWRIRVPYSFKLMFWL